MGENPRGRESRGSEDVCRRGRESRGSEDMWRRGRDSRESQDVWENPRGRESRQSCQLDEFVFSAASSPPDIKVPKSQNLKSVIIFFSRLYNIWVFFFFA